MKILANDGISAAGAELLKQAGHEIKIIKVAQEQLPNYINDNKFDAILVRSSTQIDKKLLQACPNLRLIGRAGVGLDNIDVVFAKQNNISVINTPKASSESVAELVFAHLFTGVKHLQNTNRDMPLEGDSKFNQLKKSYSKGRELAGKTLGIIGFGNIGQAVAKRGLGLGMKVIMNDRKGKDQHLNINFYDGQELEFKIPYFDLDQLLTQSDFVTLHIPNQKTYLLGKEELKKMKDSAGIINTARGGLVDETALDDALENNELAFAGLDVFENEPQPPVKLLMNPKISFSPHLGGSTMEAQERIGIELAEKIISFCKQNN
ncbi:MAG: D-2-hydroxyacid dehydrogenase [Bacteroidota bacterium]